MGMIWNQAAFRHENSRTPNGHRVQVISEDGQVWQIYEKVADIQSGFVDDGRNHHIYAHRLVFEDGTTATFSATEWRFQEQAWRDIF